MSESESEMGHGNVSNLVSLSSAGAGGGPLDDVNFTRIILKLNKKNISGRCSKLSNYQMRATVANNFNQ